jgi:predicted nucleic acid-binding protein
VKSLYLDTNVLLAVHAPGDKGHRSSAKLLTAVEEGHAKALTSTLTLIEIASAVKRSSNKFAKNDGSDQELPGSFVRRTLRTRNLEYVNLGAEIPLGQESQARIPSVYAIALKAVRTLPLKTLDLLHIASAYAAIRLHGKQLDYFTTLDAGILDHRKEIKTFLGCPSATPDEVVTLEGF